MKKLIFFMFVFFLVIPFVNGQDCSPACQPEYPSGVCRNPTEFYNFTVNENFENVNIIEYHLDSVYTEDRFDTWIVDHHLVYGRGGSSDYVGQVDISNDVSKSGSKSLKAHGDKVAIAFENYEGQVDSPWYSERKMKTRDPIYISYWIYFPSSFSYVEGISKWTNLGDVIFEQTTTSSGDLAEEMRFGIGINGVEPGWTFEGWRTTTPAGEDGKLNRSATESISITTNPTVNLVKERWTHFEIYMQRDENNGYFRFYVDGEEVADYSGWTIKFTEKFASKSLQLYQDRNMRNTVYWDDLKVVMNASDIPQDPECIARETSIGQDDCLPSQTCCCSGAPPDLVGYWKFDGNTQDSSGYNNHGRIYGNPAWTTDCISGSCLKFDGDNDYVNVSNDDSLDMNKITILLWLKRTGETGDHQDVINKGWTDRIFIGNDSLKIRGVLRNETNISVGLLGDNPTETDWYHVAMTYNSTDKARLYVDGVEQDVKDLGGNLEVNDNDLLIGGRALAKRFKGIIDEVKVYNYVLTEEEILDEYDSGSTTTTTMQRGGCPTLFVYDGKGYVKERKSRIHSQEGVDTIDEIILKTKPVAEDGIYTLSLKETTLPEHSYIDSVKLLVDGEEAKLISAVHSRYGDVATALEESDNIRTDTKVFDSIELKFLAPVNKPESFLFEIEGYNRIGGPWYIKWDVAQVTTMALIVTIAVILLIFGLMKFFAKK